MATTARRARAADSPTRCRAMARPASSVPAARSDSSAAASSMARSWARSRAASRSSTLRYSTRSASTASSSARVATGAVACGSAPTASSSPARMAYAAGRVEPRVGSRSSRQCPGWRTRWSASAVLAPSTLSSRIEVPSSSHTAFSRSSGSSAASTRRTSAVSAASGSAVRARIATRGSVPPPSCRSDSSAASASWKPSRRRLPLVVTGRLIPTSAALAASRTSPSASGRQVASSSPWARAMPARTSSWSIPPARCRSASSSAHTRSTPTSTSGCHCTPQTVGAKRAACTSSRGVSARATASAGSSSTRSSFQCTPRPPVASGPSNASSVAASVQPMSCSPTCWPSGLRSTTPPKASAQSWCPRQMPRVGTRRSAAARISARVGSSQAWLGSPASIGPPSTSSASASGVDGSSSPAYGRQTSTTAPASASQVPNSAGGQWVSCSTTSTRDGHVSAPSSATTARKISDHAQHDEQQPDRGLGKSAARTGSAALR